MSKLTDYSVEVNFPLTTTTRKGCLGRLLEELSLRRARKSKPTINEMYTLQTGNRMEEFARFWNRMISEVDASPLQLLRVVGFQRYKTIQASFTRFKAAAQTLDDEIILVEAADDVFRFCRLKGARSGRTDYSVFMRSSFLRGVYEGRNTPFSLLVEEADKALEVVEIHERKRIISMLWHVDKMHIRGAGKIDEETVLLLSQARELCSQLREDAQNLDLSSMSLNKDALRSIIREDV